MSRATRAFLLDIKNKQQFGLVYRDIDIWNLYHYKIYIPLKASIYGPAMHGHV